MKAGIFAMIFLILISGAAYAEFSWVYFTCVEDCPSAISGYQMVGCSITSDDQMIYSEGSFVPHDNDGGYAYLHARTDYNETGGAQYEEILSCEYWKEEVPMPSTVTEPKNKARFLEIDENFTGIGNIGPGSEIQTGIEYHNGTNFTCTKDCADPEKGYSLLGCVIVDNHQVNYSLGRFVPSDSNGYVDVKTADNESMSCEYWKNGDLYPISQKECASSDLLKIVKLYNSQVATFSDSVRSVIGTERYHLYYTVQNETSEYFVQTKVGLITAISRWIDENEDGAHDIINDNATIGVYVNADVLNNMIDGDKVKLFKESWGKDIRFQPLTFKTEIKMFFINISLFFVGLII